jgi:hypothetical protein
MFRITKIFENNGTAIFRVEGKIADENLNDWTDGIQLIKEPRAKVVLDLSRVWSFGPQSLQALMNRIDENLFVLNCGTEIGNRLLAAGLSNQVLD